MATATANNLNSQLQSQMEFLNLKLPQSLSFQTSSVTGTGGGAVSSMSTRRPKFKLEPLKVLEPSNKKLNLPESQRIMFILEEVIHKLEILDYVHIITSVHYDESKLRDLLSTSLSDEEKKKNYDQIFMSMCQHHRALFEAYNKGQFNVTNGGGFESSAQTKQSMELLIKNSSKDMIRALSHSQVLFDSIKAEYAKYKRNQNPQLTELTNLLNEVKEIMHERLLTTPNEQKEKTEYLKELLLREKTNNELIKKLLEEQAQCSAEKEREVHKRNEQIRKLDSDIKNVEKFSKDTKKKTEDDALQQETAEKKASEGRRIKLQQELNQLRQQFQKLVLEHRDQENQLRKEKWKHETNVEGILSRYDDDMIKKQNEYDEIEALYDEEKKQLIELEEKLKPLEEEYNKITEEQATQERIRMMEEEALNKKIKAAIVIQSYWRGFKLRKGLFKKKGKGKKGKGKGKKGKK